MSLRPPQNITGENLTSKSYKKVCCKSCCFDVLVAVTVGVAKAPYFVRMPSPRPSRSMHFGDIFETNGPGDPKRIGRVQ